MVPVDQKEQEKVMRRTMMYVVIGNELYRKGTSAGLFMKCVSTKEGQDLLADIHAGECGNHAATKTLMTKAYKHGF